MRGHGRLSSCSVVASEPRPIAWACDIHEIRSSTPSSLKSGEYDQPRRKGPKSALAPTRGNALACRESACQTSVDRIDLRHGQDAMCGLRAADIWALSASGAWLGIASGRFYRCGLRYKIPEQFHSANV